MFIHRYLSLQKYTHPHPRIMPLLYNDQMPLKSKTAPTELIIIGSTSSYGGFSYSGDISSFGEALCSEPMDHEQWLAIAQCSNTILSMLLASGSKFFSPPSIYATFSIPDGLLSVERVLVLIINSGTEVNDLNSMTSGKILNIHLQREYEDLALVKSTPSTAYCESIASGQLISSNTLVCSVKRLVDNDRGINTSSFAGSSLSHKFDLSSPLLTQVINAPSLTILAPLSPLSPLSPLTPPAKPLYILKEGAHFLSTCTTEMQGCISKGTAVKRKRSSRCFPAG